MAQFFGQVQGARGVVSRHGHQWIETIAVSRSGAIRVILNLECSGDISFVVEQISWQGKGASRILAQGILSDD
jgi:hypothetical protein